MEREVSLNLNKLLPLIEEVPSYRQINGEIERGNSTRAGILEAAKPYFLAALYQRLKRPLLVVTSQPEDAKRLNEQLLTWCDSGRVMLFSEPESLPYENISPDKQIEMERLQTLSALVNITSDDDAPPKSPPLVIISAPALVPKIVDHKDFIAAFNTIKVGMEAKPFELLSRWEALGYR